MNPQSEFANPQSDDAALVARARGGDLEAFDALVVQHETKVFNFCLYYLGDRDEAADAAQDAFVRAFRFLPKFRGDCSFGSWVTRIARNVCHDAGKRRSAAPRSFSSLVGEDDSEFDPPGEMPTPDEDLTRRQRQEAVARALSQIPDQFRAVLVLFDLQGRSYDECAEALDVPMGTVKSRLNRARAALRKALEAERELFDA